MSGFRTLVVPYDFSPHSDAALDAAVALAERFDAALHLVHVLHEPWVDYPSLETGVVSESGIPVEVRDSIRRSLDETIARHGSRSTRISVQIVESSSPPSEAIVEYCSKVDADLIVMGTHGRTGFAHVFLGSVTERTLRLADCPVLTVRAPGEDGA